MTISIGARTLFVRRARSNLLDSPSYRLIAAVEGKAVMLSGCNNKVKIEID
jgi:hypothetical protein